MQYCVPPNEFMMETIRRRRLRRRLNPYARIEEMFEMLRGFPHKLIFGIFIVIYCVSTYFVGFVQYAVLKRSSPASAGSKTKSGCYTSDITEIISIQNGFKILDLRRCELETLSEKLICECSDDCPEGLDLSFNRIYYIDDGFICVMASLRSLNLASNRLQELPENFGDLQALEILSLRDNMLKNLPLSFGRMRKLSYLDLTGNKFQNFIRDVLSGPETISNTEVAKVVVAHFEKALNDSYFRISGSHKFWKWVLVWMLVCTLIVVAVFSWDSLMTENFPILGSIIAKYEVPVPTQPTTWTHKLLNHLSSLWNLTAT